MNSIIDIDRVIEELTAETGLDDFGDPTYRDGLDALVAALTDEAGLSDVGHVVAVGQITSMLKTRLLVEQRRSDHAELDEERIEAPIFSGRLVALRDDGAESPSSRDPATGRCSGGRRRYRSSTAPEHLCHRRTLRGRASIRNCAIALQDADETQAQQMYDKYAGREQIGFVAMRNNVSSAHVWAVSKGAGIGWLPTYIPAVAGPLIPLDIDVKFSLDIWLTYHPDAKRIPRVKQLIDWTIQAFDGRKYPWFRDELVHPNDLQKTYKGEPLVNLFAGFVKE